MELTALGHQGWLVRAGRTAVMVDPLLRGEFGPSAFIRGLLSAAVCIPPEVARDVEAVLLTCHHADHFDVEGLERLAIQSPRVRFFVHDRFPEIAVSVLRQRNLDVSVIRVGSAFELGEIEARFVRIYSGEFPWERCSASLLLGHDGRNVFVQSEGDPKAAGQFVSETHLALLTNNSQLRAGVRTGFFANARDPGDPRSVISSYMSSLEAVNTGRSPPSALVFTGTDFSFFCGGSEAPIVFDDVHSDRIEAALRRLSNGVQVHFARAGRRWRLHGSREVEVLAALPCNKPYRPAVVQPETMVVLGELIAELNRITVPLLLSPLGRMLVNCHRFSGEPLGPERLLIELDVRGEVLRVSFNVNTAEFSLASDHASLTSTPYYLRAPLQFFVATLRGNLGVWELAHHPGVKQAYVGRAIDSPLSFLASYFCPTVRPEHFATQYNLRSCGLGAFGDGEANSGRLK